MTDFKNIPIKCGIRFCPPALIIIYETHRPIGDANVTRKRIKLKKRVMPIRDFESNSFVNMHACNLQAKYMKDLDDLPFAYIEKMLWLLQYHLKGLPFSESLDLVNKKFNNEIYLNEDLNKAGENNPDQTILIEDCFKKTASKPGDPDFVYDKRVEFNAVKSKTDWDSSDDDLDSFFDK